MAAEVLRRLALLTDSEAELCLNHILKGVAVDDPSYEELMASPRDMVEALSMVARDTGTPVPVIGEVSPQERPRVVRAVLAEMAADPSLSQRVEASLATARPKLLDPVTSALVLAGIITVLSTSVSVEYETVDGKKKLKVHVEKKPTATEILQRFFGFFL